MCGIVGLFCKSPGLEPELGAHLAAMLVQMDGRGPDSAGVAIYRDPAPSGASKLTLYSADSELDWHVVCGQLAVAFGGAEKLDVRARHCVVLVDADPADAEAWVHAERPDLRVMSAGRVIEILGDAALRSRLSTEAKRGASRFSVASSMARYEAAITG